MPTPLHADGPCGRARTPAGGLTGGEQPEGRGGADGVVDDISESHVKALDPLPGTMHGYTHKTMFTQTF